MRLGVIVLVSIVAACGRVGFDARGDGGSFPGDGRPDTPADSVGATAFLWYPLGDDFMATGRAVDATGHGRTAACIGAECPALAIGRTGTGTAPRFNGFGNVLRWQPTGTEADLPRFTATAWVKLERRPSDFEMVVARPLAGGSANSFGLDHSNAGLLEYYSQGGASLFSTTTLPLGTWTHLAIAYDGTTKYAFINGAAAASGSTGVQLTYDASPVTVGADITSAVVDHFFQGQLADVMIFDRVLTQPEIMALAQ